MAGPAPERVVKPGRVIRVGLIGCGQVGQLRAAALLRTRDLCLTAVADADASRAAATAGPAAARVHPEWRALVEAKDVDAVVVSTPPSLHAEMSIAALAAGKHVLCEKPLARTSGECRDMVDAAARSKRTLATGFNYRFYPSFRKARAWLEAGLIGPLDHIDSQAGYSGAQLTFPWLHDPEVVGGGALRDIGIHLIDLTRDFLGEVAEVKGFTSNAAFGFPGCEDNGFALLRGTGGQIATLQASWTEWRRYRFRVELVGSRGSIRASCFPMLADVVSAKERGGPTRRQIELFPRTNIMERLRSYRWVVVESLVLELEAFARATRGEAGEASGVATGFDGLRAIEIAEAAGAGSARAVGA